MRLVLVAALVVALPATGAAGAPAAPELPAPYAAPAAVKPPRVIGWPQGTAPQAPPNFRVTAYARGLDNPRSLLVLPNGDVLVAESRGAAGETRPSANRITLLRDTDGSGVADKQFMLLDGLDRPYGLALRRDRLYVGDTDAVLSCPFLVGQTRLHGECRTLFALPSAGGRDHWTRNLAFNPDETRLYVSVGSSSNVDEDRVDVKDPMRAAILVAQPDGRELRVYASGLRNPVGLAFEPVTGRLFTTVNERDLLGDELVPDYLTHVEDGAFYGWPYAYFGAHEDPRKKGERTDLVARAIVPDLALEAHGAPLGLVFYGRENFPRSYRGGAFIALHGSWNRSSFAGYKVVQVPFSNGRIAGSPQDFLTGFIADPDKSEVYGRPAGLAVATDGALLVADDAGNTIWRVTFKCAACTPDPAPPRPNDSRRARPALAAAK
jgi:glucose/arabinose dehydrogenase